VTGRRRRRPSGRPEDAPGPNAPVEFRTSLDRLLRHSGKPTVQSLDVVFHQWTELVGEVAAGHSRPILLDKERLVIEAETTTWASELRWHEAALLRHLRTVLGSDAPGRLEVRVARRGGC
jgi:predicted nucleic acid-binding Zn ribbon protein